MVNIPHNVFIEASPERVYEAISTGEGWSSWFSGSSFQLDESGKGEVRLNWRNRGERSQDNELVGEIEDANPGKGFAFEWQPTESRTVVSFALEPYKEGTLVAFEETGFTASDEDIKALVSHATGWAEALTLLKVYLEHGITYSQETIDYDNLA